MSGQTVPKPKKSLIDRCYSILWHLATNKDVKSSLLSLCYAWTVTRAFRFILFVHSLFSGTKPIVRYCEAIQDVEPNSLPGSGTGERKILSKAIDNERMDKGLLLKKSESLFRLEVILVYLPVCAAEVHELLTCDSADVELLGSRIYYKAYYDASRWHGGLQMDLLRGCLSSLKSCHVSIRSLVARCDVPVSWDLQSETLHKIASNLMPGHSSFDRLTKGKHWGLIGFQGEDPCTDFRGVGELGLHHLNYFCSHHPLYARRMISESGTQGVGVSSEEQPWYPFALCGIHVTKFLCDLLQNGILERNLIEAQLRGPHGIEQFTDALFSFLFVRCHLDWAEGVDKNEIRSVFQFEMFFKEFGAFLLTTLEQSSWHNDELHPQLTKWW